MLISLFTFLLIELLIFKAVKKYKKNSSKIQDEIGYETKTIFSTNKNVAYIQACQIVVALVVLYIIKKTRDFPLNVVMLAYIFIINLLTSF